MNCMVSLIKSQLTLGTKAHSFTHMVESKGVNFTTRLMDFQPYMELIELEPGTCLYAQESGVVEESRRGVSFLLFPL